MAELLHFACDYMEGAHPRIIDRLAKTNMDHTAGYGCDEYCEHARSLIREACSCPGADVFFLVGGTQANATVIDSVLHPWEGVIAAHTGHVSVHEAGAIEAGGHKVMELPGKLGKLSANQVDEFASSFEADGNRDHMVAPGMCYISQPTEYGTLYSKAELEAISSVCRAHGLKLYVDGARLAYALAAPENDVTLADLARLCDVFYIGGTKCGTLFGEAVVIPQSGSIPHFFTLIKQHGALFAKGRILGIQFECLFEDGLYNRIGAPAIEAAEIIKRGLIAGGERFYFDSPTNQIFLVVEDARLAYLDSVVEYSFWEKYDETHTVIRVATSWASNVEDAKKLVEAFKGSAE